MKKGRHPYKELSAAFVLSVRKAGKYSDGNGLELIVKPNNYKQWQQRLTIRGTGRRITLGGFGRVGLKPLPEVRRIAQHNRDLARSGIDPRQERDKSVSRVPTFEELATEVWKEVAKNFTNQKHINQWINTLRTYVFPVIGSKPVDQVTPEDIFRVLNPIWSKKQETASRVAQRMNKVMKRAKFLCHRPDNPLDDIRDVLGTQEREEKHFEMLAYEEISSFVSDLRKSDIHITYKLAVEFLIQTCVGSKNVRCAEWSEIDLKAKVWNIPADKIKVTKAKRKPLTVPLTKRAIEILEAARRHTGDSQWVFTQQRKQHQPIDEDALNKTIQKLGYRGTTGEKITAHGMKSAARTWASERTHFTHEIKEAVLAHVIKDKAEAAYNRGEPLDRRREFMEKWSEHISTLQRQYAGKPRIAAKPIT